MDIETTAEPELTRAEGLWFEDCGLVIQAELTLFRVSRDFLAGRSPVFKDMLSLPPPKDEEMMHGCPFVRLPDSAEDITAFLKALIYYEFFEPFPAPTTITILASVLRMSHKYDVVGLRKRALMHLSSSHPTTLQGWEHGGAELLKSLDSLHSRRMYVGIIPLARQISADWILPTAFYWVCKYSDEGDIVNGDTLTPSEKTSCFVAVRRLETTHANHILRFLSSEVTGCEATDPDDCVRSRVEQRRYADEWRDYEPERPAILPLELWEASEWERLDVCASCLRTMKEEHAAAKQELWDELPSLFGLPDWTTLQKMEADAFK
ncbi:hypothetical protein B0H15DRAFT_988618 [Mycena belliarum]|uniref:BTB domain-containing protein n=1 Tax=Mycena belliarum TaxID=1033014 RepID=A0AAD6TZR5_9AGAR|nr:hypothetical protein B0H15DRAFT_988618 [Mycena belliae]